MNAPLRAHRPIRMGTWSGRRVDLIDPAPADVDFSDVAEHLARICRFNGAADPWWSVASHSILVRDIVRDWMHRPDLAAHALLHDAHETYLQDRITPVKHAIARMTEGIADAAAFSILVERHDAAIHAAARLRWPLTDEERLVIRKADAHAVATEVRQFLRNPNWMLAEIGVPPLRLALVPEPVPESAATFRRALAEHGIAA